ncbi:hypothetical protein BR63_03340 [Thermanaerosceptrum fracticalcis]|jgi:hypothetical protein|uniref:Uncharacterized protein n=1 Tax=Thermanaerosceptrum fracticalcis TaxID=1712410 RepID=A0A7G6E031_THEFR|nr:hypothetical protein [Thermanaerosceptrum fracticalcis]QNB45435.1 hypothetical protein BR63_03340 [Thermanaerosceptrum fracticalcis]
MGWKVASFDDFAYACHYFTSKYSVNNGYCCTHPMQEEVENDENGIQRGMCFCWSCPLGIEPDEEDFCNPDVDWNGITREDCTSSISGEFSVDGDYIMVNTGKDASEDEKIAWRNYERRINRYNPDWRESE